MKNYKKTFIASLVSFFIGTSCCWLSSLAVWLGGVGFLGGLITVLEQSQFLMIVIGLILVMLSFVIYRKKKQSRNFDSKASCKNKNSFGS